MGQAQEAQLGNLARRGKAGAEKDQLMKVSREFESLFLNLMLKEMRATVPKFDPLHSYAEETYQEMLDQELTKSMAQQKGVGLADMMYRQLSRLESPTDS